VVSVSCRLGIRQYVFIMQNVTKYVSKVTQSKILGYGVNMLPAFTYFYRATWSLRSLRFSSQQSFFMPVIQLRVMAGVIHRMIDSLDAASPQFPRSSLCVAMQRSARDD